MRIVSPPFARRAFAGLFLLAGCGAPRGSMIDYAGLRADYGADFFVRDHTVAVRWRAPRPGMALVVWPPRVEGGDVVFNAGVTSSGNAGERTSCFQLDGATLPSDWENHMFWRETSGERVRITAIDRGDEARRVVAQCAERAAR